MYEREGPLQMFPLFCCFPPSLHSESSLSLQTFVTSELLVIRVSKFPTLLPSTSTCLPKRMFPPAPVFDIHNGLLRSDMRISEVQRTSDSPTFPRFSGSSMVD